MKNIGKLALTGLVLILGINSQVFAGNDVAGYAAKPSVKDSSCGAGNWVSTGVAGPLGWVWHYRSDATTGSITDANYICGHFYKDTDNCTIVPRTHKKEMTYNTCSYDTGIYSLNGTNVSKNPPSTSTQCQVC